MGMTGRRRADTPVTDIPDDVQPGDYWRVTDRAGEPLDCGDAAASAGNLTRGVYMVSPPRGGGVATLRLHTVREEEDGTISVRPGDGSSNSILISGGAESWHGYIEHGVWNEC